MSVLKSKRKESQFEVFHHFYKMRQEITALMLRNFGYDFVKAENRLAKWFGNKDYPDLTSEEQERYDRLLTKYESFDAWFLSEQRSVIKSCMGNICEYIFTANSIYPTNIEELTERRLLQDKAIGQCHRLTQELQYTIETLPVECEPIYTLC